jgi:hypothetical protein
VAAAIRDPALRRATGFDIADIATRPEVAVAIFRTFGEDGAAVDALARRTARERERYGGP